MVRKAGIVSCVTLLVMFLTFCFAKADEITDHYMERIFSYRLEIIHKASDLKRAAIRSHRQDQLESLDVRHKGNVSRDEQQKSNRAQDEKSVAEKAFENLGKEIDTLKSEIIKYYKRKTPKKLKAAIDDLRTYYQEQRVEVSNYISNLYNRDK